GPRHAGGEESPLPDGSDVEPGPVQHAPAGRREGSPAVLCPRRDRDPGMEPHRKRPPVREVPRREETEGPRALRRGPVQTRERSGQCSARPGAPSDRKDPSEDARTGGPRMVAATSTCRADPGWEEARPGGGKCRGGRVVPQLARTSWTWGDPAPHAV